VTQARPYAGVDAGDRQARRRARLLEAGLDLLGRDADPAELTVRGICQEAGLATRYFYENFSDKEQLIGAVFDWMIARLAATTQAAVVAAPPEEQNRAGIANIVRTIESEPRIGRLMFGSQVTNPAVIRKRRESEAFFAILSGQHVEVLLQRPSSEGIKAFSHFVVGGVTQTLSAWVAGELSLSSADLVDELGAIIDAFSQSRLFAD
jgi:AcrR family transcriptional regulator